MKSSILLIFVIVLFFNTSNVHAFGGITSDITGSKVNTHITVKPDQTCHNWKDNGWIVEISYYYGDNPSQTAYSDYLSDFSHYFTQYKNTCKIQPVANPDK